MNETVVAIIIVAFVFFFIDLFKYKPRDFINHKKAVLMLFIHHLLAAYIVLGWTAVFYDSYRFKVWLVFLLIIVVHWQILKGKCIVSVWTQQLGPKCEVYCPYIGPWDIIINDKGKACEELYNTSREN